MQTYSYIIRQGNKVTVYASLLAPSLEGWTPPTLSDGETLEWVDAAPTAQLPAIWDNGEVRQLPAKPGEYYVFDFTSNTWELNQAEAWAAVRSQRDTLLTTSDGEVARALEQGLGPISPGWVDYRQALRDITKQPDPTAIVWPILPEKEDPTHTYPIFRGNEKLDKLFTVAEQQAIVASTLVNANIKHIYDRFLNAAYLTYANPETELGLSLLVQEGLLTAERKAAIVQTMLPSAIRETT